MTTHSLAIAKSTMAALGIAITSLSAAPVIYEPFAQTAGAITGKVGGTGLGNWAIDGTASTVATTPTLAYGQLANSAGELTLPSGSGNTAYVTTTSALADASLLADGATLWFSFVYSKAAGGGSNERSGFAFGTERLVTSGTNGAFMTNSGNGLGVFTKDKGILPITWNGGGVGVTGTGTAFTNYNDTVLIVGKVVWGTLPGDVETLTIWSPNETSLPADEDALVDGFSKTMTGVDQSLFDTISMQQRNSGGNIIYDELRFGAALSDVLPVDTVTPTLSSITDNQPSLTIYEDVAAVTYTLSFDRHMNVSTITADDFINAGTATASVGAITQVSARVIRVQLLPTTTGTLQLKIPSGSVLSSFVPLSLDTTSDILDDRTFTIDPGPTPGNDRRWDGPTITGITDGVGQGGTGTWSTSNTNWDRGPGIEAPAAWDNTAGTAHTATFEGTAGTATLGEAISLKNLTFTHTTGTYTITGSALNFTSGTITANNPPANSNGVTISSNITGSPALNLVPMDGDEQFTLNPAASGSMSIGIVSGSGGTGSEKLNLQGGAGSSGTIADANGVKVIVTSGAWTLNGASFGYGHEISGGTLTLNANLQGTQRNVLLSGTGVLNYNLTGAVTAPNATATSGDNGFRITGGTLDQTSGSAINTNASTTHIDLAGTLTFAGTNGANSNLHLGSGIVWLKGGNRQITVTNSLTTLTIGGVIQNDSVSGRSLTKAGDGTLELRGANTYNGATAVNGGKLLVATGTGTRCTSAVTVADTAGCIFGVKLAAANGQWASSSSLTVSGTNSQIDIDYNSTAPSTSTSEDPIKVANLTVSGVGTLKVLGITPSTPAGTYPLINFTGTGPAAADPYTGMTLSLPPGVTGKLTTTANHVNLVIEAGGTFTVTYDDNDSSGGSVPVDSNTYATAATVTVLGNTGSLVKTGLVFTGWNTQADGLGTHYNPAATFPMGSANITLYADWKTPYDNWAAGFTPNPGGTAANPDGDALNNLQELAFAFNPNVSDGSGPLTISGASITQNGPPQIYVDPGTGQYFLRYTRRTDYVAAGLNYISQFAADSLGAGAFENVAGGSVIAAGTGAGGVAIEAVSIEFPDALPVSGKKARFGRVEVEIP